MDVELASAISELIISLLPKIILELCALLYFFVLQSLNEEQIFDSFCYYSVSISWADQGLHMKIIIILYKCDFLKLFFVFWSIPKKKKNSGTGLVVRQEFCAATEDFSSWNSLKGNFIEMLTKVTGADSLVRIQLASQETIISKGLFPSQPVPTLITKSHKPKVMPGQWLIILEVYKRDSNMIALTCKSIAERSEKLTESHRPFLSNFYSSKPHYFYFQLQCFNHIITI